MRHGAPIDPVVMATALILGVSHAKRQRTNRLIVTKPTPEQLARREREEWNAEVDRRKAEKKGPKRT